MTQNHAKIGQNRIRSNNNDIKFTQNHTKSHSDRLFRVRNPDYAVALAKLKLTDGLQNKKRYEKSELVNNHLTCLYSRYCLCLGNNPNLIQLLADKCCNISSTHFKFC